MQHNQSVISNSYDQGVLYWIFTMGVRKCESNKVQIPKKKNLLKYNNEVFALHHFHTQVKRAGKEDLVKGFSTINTMIRTTDHIVFFHMGHS